jgi:hypothetical protein
MPAPLSMVSATRARGDVQCLHTGEPKIVQWASRQTREVQQWTASELIDGLANLGYVISDQTVGNILRRRALPPAPERKRTTTWPDFIRTHLALLAGTDFFTAQVLTLCRLAWISMEEI